MPPVCLPYSPEFDPRRQENGRPALTAMAVATNGKERLDLGEVWNDLPKLPQFVSLTPWLVLLTALVFLVEIAERRIGFLHRSRAWRQRRTVTGVATPAASVPGSSSRRRSAQTGGPPGTAPVVTESPAMNAPAPSDASPHNALAEARKRASRRLGQ